MSRSSSARPAEPWRSKKATWGLTTATTPAKASTQARAELREARGVVAQAPSRQQRGRGVDPGAQRSRRSHRGGQPSPKLSAMTSSFLFRRSGRTAAVIGTGRRPRRRRHCAAPIGRSRRMSATWCRGRRTTGQLAQHLPRGPGVAEGGRADLDGVGPGQQQLHGVAPEKTPPTPTMRQLGEGRPALPHGPHRHRMHGAAGQAATAGPQRGRPGLGVDGQAQERVDQGQASAPPSTRPRRSRPGRPHWG